MKAIYSIKLNSIKFQSQIFYETKNKLSDKKYKLIKIILLFYDWGFYSK
jgi:hypothetical protein